MSAPRRPKRLGRQFAFAAAAIIGAYLLLQLLASGLLLEPFYNYRIERKLIETYDLVRQMEGVDLAVMATVEQQDVTVSLFEGETGAVLYSSRSEDAVRAQLLENSLGEVRAALSGTQADYFITNRASKTVTASGTELTIEPRMTLGGRVGDDLVQLSIQLEPIRETLSIARQFTALVGLLLIAVAVAVLPRAVRPVTRPIEQMTEAAQRMARRDFSLRCDDGFANEIGSLARSINSMSDQLQRYTGELQAANEKLKEDIDVVRRTQISRRNLISNISHDVKTPLALISGYAAGLASGMADTPEKMREYCEVIIDESDRMLVMLDRMLQLSRVESGGVELNIESFCLTDLIDDLLEENRAEIERVGIHLTREYAPDICVRSDYVCSEQVLRNYIQNAVQHMGAGLAMRVRVTPSASGRVRVAVFNSARPFDGEDLAELWDSFYRGEKSRKRAGCQSGLGLAIVRGNMELLGEQYGVENVPGGVEFFMELPSDENEK